MSVIAEFASRGPSMARTQRSLGPDGPELPLWPPQVRGCPVTSSEAMQYPLEVAYDYERIPRALFDQAPLPGLTRWAPLLPPLAPGLSMGEGGTPLVEAPAIADWLGLDVPLLLKNEAQNPTFSHKDRLNLCTVSTAVAIGAPGICVASTGNHGLSAAAYAARAGLPAIIVTGTGGQPTFPPYFDAVGATVLTVPSAERWPLLNRIVAETGYHPVSNLTRFHTGHPFGPEGYKTVAYELFLQLGRQAPSWVVVPTGYGELLFGIAKGFRELVELGLLDRVPRVFSAEPKVRGPLARALAGNEPAVAVEAVPTSASGIGCLVNSYRGVVAVRETGGRGLLAEEAVMAEAKARLGRTGLWQEVSGVAALAALKTANLGRPEGPVVVVLTSTGLKDLRADDLAPAEASSRDEIEAAIAAARKGHAA